MAICTPSSARLVIVPLIKKHDKTLAIEAPTNLSAISVAPLRSLRARIDDLLVLKVDGSLSILTYGMLEMPLKIENSGDITNSTELREAVEKSWDNVPLVTILDLSDTIPQQVEAYEKNEKNVVPKL